MAKRRITIENYRNVGEPKGIRWVGQGMPANISIPTIWQCRHNHEPWPARYNTIEQGHGCPTCKAEAHRHSEADYVTMGDKCGLIWKGAQVPSTRQQPTVWQCKANGHAFNRTYDFLYHVTRRKSGYSCRECVSGAPLTTRPRLTCAPVGVPVQVPAQQAQRHTLVSARGGGQTPARTTAWQAA